MGLEEHPGYFGLTSKGVIAIHADWPMYPFEHGWQEALLAFASLPKATHFIQIDDIDRCVLFVAGPISPGQDCFDERLSHVAAWYEDLVDLVREGHVEGVELIRDTTPSWLDGTGLNHAPWNLSRESQCRSI